MLPPEKRVMERKRLLEKIQRTRDTNGTWNDSPRAPNWTNGTAMIVLALLGDQVPLPPKLEQKEPSRLR